MVEAYLSKHKEWTEELNQLRSIIAKTELKEEIKWGAPVYTLEGKNVVGIGAFKKHYGLWFFNGVFLEDKAQVLVNANEEKTKALRQMRFEKGDKVDEKLVLNYVKEAINNQKLGKEIKPELNKKFSLDANLKEALDKNAKLKAAYEKLSQAKQREYSNYITEAKREATKLSRIEKITPMIIAQQGLYDKYKNC